MNYRKGFIATISVILLTTGIMSFSLITLVSALAFSDFVYKKELRIQANLNAKACLDQIILIISRDYFLSGQIILREFGCTIDIVNDLNGNVVINGRASFKEISTIFNKKILFSDNYMLFN
jgi:hypothetical protein